MFAIFPPHWRAMVDSGDSGIWRYLRIEETFVSLHKCNLEFLHFRASFQRMIFSIRTDFITNHTRVSSKIHTRTALWKSKPRGKDSHHLRTEPRTQVRVTGCCEAGGMGYYAATKGVGYKSRNYSDPGSRRSLCNGNAAFTPPLVWTTYLGI